MARKSNIIFNPRLSIKENAAKNNVSASGIYYYIRTHNVDRNQQRAEGIVAEIKAELKKEPNLSQAKVAERLGRSVTTINKYWTVATGAASINAVKSKGEPKAYVWDKDIPAITSKEYLVFSDTLKDIPFMLNAADSVDVSGLHDFLYAHPERPLLIIGNGGANDHYAGFLCEMCCGIARCITPLELASMSDEVVSNCRYLFMSSGGGNDDIKYAIDRIVKLNPEHAAVYATYISSKSHYHRFDGTGAKIFKFGFTLPWKDWTKKAFISVTSKFFRDGIFYRAFSGHNVGDIKVNLSSEACYKYQLNRSNGKITNPKKIQHLYVLYNGYSMPVAMDLESVFGEAGMVSVQLTDYRNFCHGRFLFASNHTKHIKKGHSLGDSDVAMILYVTPRDKQLVQSIRELAIPTKTPIVIIETKYNDARASIDLLAKTSVFIADFQEKGRGVNPCDPKNYSSADIDKRIPENNVKFAQELKKNGPLTLYDESVTTCH